MNVQSEDIRLDPELYDSCRQDISRLCQNVAFGNAQVSMHTYVIVTSCFIRWSHYCSPHICVRVEPVFEATFSPTA